MMHTPLLSMSMSGDSKDTAPLGKENQAWLESCGVLLACNGGTRQFQQVQMEDGEGKKCLWGRGNVSEGFGSC